MPEIKCPRCGAVVSIEQSDFDSVVRQVRDEEVRREVEERSRLLEESAEARVR